MVHERNGRSSVCVGEQRVDELDPGSDLYGDDRLNILEFFGEQGARFSKNQLLNALFYIGKMVKDERIIQITEDDQIHTVIMFGICNDYEPFYKKGMWEYLEHDPSGETVYIELAVSKKWSKGLRNDVRELLLSKYPSLKYGKWFKWGKFGDRPVTIRRRTYV